MRVTDNGASVVEVVDTIKRAIKAARVSTTEPGRDLRVATVNLTLNVVATRSTGGGLDFRLPFIGMDLKLGTKVTTRDTHTININLAAQDHDTPEVRDHDVESVFVEAVQTIRETIAQANAGDDRFFMTDSTVQIAFAVTREGTIKLGVDGSLSGDVTHTFTLNLVPA